MTAHENLRTMAAREAMAEPTAGWRCWGEGMHEKRAGDVTMRVTWYTPASVYGWRTVFADHRCLAGFAATMDEAKRLAEEAAQTGTVTP